MKKCILLISGLFIFQSILGQNWQQLGNGNPGSVEKLYLDNASNTLYASGAFWKNINDTAFGIAYLDSGMWQPLGTYDFKGGNIIYSFIKYDDTLYIGGSFTKFYGAPGDYLLKWNGSNWDSMTYSLNGQMNCMGSFQGDHYSCGMFGSFGPIAANYILKHQLHSWTGLPGVFLGATIRSLHEFNNNLIIAGNFAIIGSSNGNVIGWDGSSFFPVDQGITYGGNPPEFIHEMESYNGRLYFSGYGNFTANSITGNNLISWDGIANWSNVGGGSNGFITDLQAYNGYLYACGTFSTIGNIYVSGIARWDGTTWCSLGSNFDGPIYSMSVFNNELIVAGDFTHIDGLPISHVAKWIGGGFISSCSSMGLTETQCCSDKFSISPIPVNNNLKVIYHLDENNCILQIANVNQQIIHVETLKLRNGELSIDVERYAKGYYTITLFGKANYGTKFFIH